MADTGSSSGNAREDGEVKEGGEVEEGELREEEVEEEGENYFLSDYPALGDFSKALLSQVGQATKTANGLPVEGDDFDYYSSFPGFQIFCSKMGSRVTRSIGRLIRHQSLPCYWPPPKVLPKATPTSEKGTGHIQATDEVEERMEALVEANDVLLERAGVLLDEAAGLRKREAEVPSHALQLGTAEVASWNKKEKAQKAVDSYHFLASRTVHRPQLHFPDQPDNSHAPFIPRLRSKPNALQPLSEVYQRLQSPMSLNALISNSKEWAQMKQKPIHPYQYELENFEPTEEQLQSTEPQPPGNLEEVPYTYIDTEEGLRQLLPELVQCKEFAIDLENHSYRSFQGFVCLMQLSTRCHDYLVDTLALRSHLPLLLDPFTNPAIVKVMHGADWDVEWLQRDFGLYLVNLFDTGQASRVLGLPKFSLAFLLHYCCGVQADKQYQLADWRIRPLPPQMEKYAREDTHYLLYIYDRMRNELIRRGNERLNLLHSVLTRSRDVCLRVYHKAVFNQEAYLKLYFKHKRSFNSQQLRCLQLLYKWRDRVAREEDESPGYVLPNHMLFQISEQLPREAHGVLSCCTPIPTLLRQQLQEVFMLVQQAREAPLSNELPKLQPKTPPTSTHPHTLPTTPSHPPHYTPHHSHTPIITDHVDGNPLIQRVIVCGTPIKRGIPTLSAMEPLSPPLPPVVRERIRQIHSSFPHFLSKFLEAKPMTTMEFIYSQAAATPLDATPVQATPTTVDDVMSGSRSDGASEERVTPKTTFSSKTDREEKGLKSRKLLSIREMGNKRRKVSPPKEREEKEEGEVEEEEEEEEEEEGELVDVREVKKRKGNERSKFTPFDYQGANFAEYTTAPSKPVHIFRPSSGQKEKRPVPHSGPRSILHKRSGERSHTCTAGSQSRKHSSWPRKT